MVWLMALAMAAEPEVAWHDDGFLHGSIVLKADKDAVDAFLRDPVKVAGLSPDVLGMTPTKEPPEGDCRTYDVKTRGMWRPLTYVVRRCGTAGRFEDRLVESTDFTRIHNDWTTEATAEGATTVRYKGVAEVDLPLPASMLRKAQVGAMRTTLSNLRDTLETGS